MITEIKTNTGIKLCDTIKSLVDAYDKECYTGIGANNLVGPYETCEEYIAWVIGTKYLLRAVNSEKDIEKLEKIARNLGFKDLELLINFYLSHSISLTVRSCFNCSRYHFQGYPEHTNVNNGCFGGMCMYECRPTSEFDSFIDCPGWEP